VREKHCWLAEQGPYATTVDDDHVSPAELGETETSRGCSHWWLLEKKKAEYAEKMRSSHPQGGGREARIGGGDATRGHPQVRGRGGQAPVQRDQSSKFRPNFAKFGNFGGGRKKTPKFCNTLIHVMYNSRLVFFYWLYCIFFYSINV
jgi:hypothetical protein